MTIPRLELAAATLSIQLDRTLKRELEIPIQSSTFWTDSTTVLQYLMNDSKRFHTYVANRVAFIRANSDPRQWKYVNTKNNPADEASRGSLPCSFLKNERWKNGPEFLQKPDVEWSAAQNQPEFHNLLDSDPEVKQDVSSFSTTTELSEESALMKIFCRFSSWIRLKKFIAWCIRCQARFRRTRTQSTISDVSLSENQPITVTELRVAEKKILICIQKETFNEELYDLSSKSNNCVKKSSSLFKLDPILKDGLIRVGGRLNRAPITQDARNPVILPKKNRVVDLIIKHFHVILGHSGREHVLAALRERYWIIHGNSTVRRVLSSCFSCKRRQAKVGEQKMADLPHDRVNPSAPPFTCVGVDYFGPFIVREKRSMVKRYGVIFTCLAVRAIHLEISRTLDTDSFIMALRRFISRRGQVKEIRSDNGTNLVGGEKEIRQSIQEWNQQQIHNFLLQREIKWTFNPPTGSHHGGVWERCIRTVRKILRALVKQQTLNDEALATLMCEVEAIVNSRPLTAVSSDPKDMEPLTPNHLLLLRGQPSLPPGLFSKDDLYSRKRWRQIQYMSDLFWKRWTREYLPRLQERQKWSYPRRNFAVDDLVLVVDKSCPRNTWPVGRITKVFPDKKGFVRRVVVKTSSAILERPISKLCLLESI